MKIAKARTVFAFMFYATFCFMIVYEKTIPDPLIAIVSGLMGYYFGSSVPKKVKDGV